MELPAFQILTYPELERLFEKNCADSGQSISLPLVPLPEPSAPAGASGKGWE